MQNKKDEKLNIDDIKEINLKTSKEYEDHLGNIISYEITDFMNSKICSCQSNIDSVAIDRTDLTNKDYKTVYSLQEECDNLKRTIEELEKSKYDIINTRKESYLDNEKICKGMTTRIVDSTIQYMFKHPNDWIELIDHSNTAIGDKLVKKIVEHRLLYEHGLRLEQHISNNNLYRIKK